MNCDVNYNDEVECKNTHPKLLPQDIETMSTKSVELLAKSGVTGASQKKRNGNPMVVPVTKRVTSKKQPQVHHRSVLSDDQIAELKLRINKSREFHSAEHNGRITERFCHNDRSSDRLLKQ